MQWSQLDAEACSLARTLSIMGDRWTLLILRDCFLRIRRFDDFQERLGIGRPILADRLQKLVAADILAKVPYQERPVRFEYRLTSKGLDLYPVIISLVHFGDQHLAGPEGRPVLHRHTACGNLFDPVLVCSACGEPVGPRDIVVEPGPGAKERSPVPSGDVGDA
jgi:DNA-binding HxlR family transcriptional regulator